MSDGNQFNQNDYFRNLFTGTVKPKRYRRPASVPVFNRNIVIAQEGDLFTKVRCWVYEPTIEWPDTSILLQLKNGAGSCFCRLSLDDISILVEALTQWKSELLQLLPSLLNKKASIQSLLDKYQQTMEFLQAQGEIPQQDEEDEMSENSSQRRRDSRGRYLPDVRD
jgi:hypothetical protein